MLLPKPYNLARSKIDFTMEDLENDVENDLVDKENFVMNYFF